MIKNFYLKDDGFSNEVNQDIVYGFFTRQGGVSKSEYNLIVNHIDNSGLPSSVKKYFSIKDLNKILSFQMNFHEFSSHFED